MSEQSARSLSIVLVGGHRLVRAGLRLLLEQRPGWLVARETEGHAKAAAAAARPRPDVFILDAEGPAGDGLALLPVLLAAAPDALVIVLADGGQTEMHLRAARLGARGVVFKESESAALYRAVERVHAGELWFKRALLGTLFEERVRAAAGPEGQRFASLTPRERRIIDLLCEGLKNRQIADRLHLSHITVRHHLVSIYDKLNVSTRLELTVYAYRHGLAPPAPSPPEP